MQRMVRLPIVTSVSVPNFFSASAARGEPQFVALNNTRRSRSGNVSYAMCTGQGRFLVYV